MLSPNMRCFLWLALLEAGWTKLSKAGMTACSPDFFRITLNRNSRLLFSKGLEILFQGREIHIVSLHLVLHSFPPALLFQLVICLWPYWKTAAQCWFSGMSWLCHCPGSWHWPRNHLSPMSSSTIHRKRAGDHAFPFRPLTEGHCKTPAELV